jgi:hypothetical protein
MDNFNRSFDPLAETILLLGTLAAEVPAEVEADREVLATLTERLGGATGGMKNWGAWSAEKASRPEAKNMAPLMASGNLKR